LPILFLIPDIIKTNQELTDAVTIYGGTDPEFSKHINGLVSCHLQVKNTDIGLVHVWEIKRKIMTIQTEELVLVKDKLGMEKYVFSSLASNVETGTGWSLGLCYKILGKPYFAACLSKCEIMGFESIVKESDDDLFDEVCCEKIVINGNCTFNWRKQI